MTCNYILHVQLYTPFIVLCNMAIMHLSQQCERPVNKQAQCRNRERKAYKGKNLEVLKKKSIWASSDNIS